LGNKGNPPRFLRGGLTALVGGLAAFTLMAAEAQLRWGIVLGFLAVFVATFGVLDLVGSFDDAEENVAHRTTLFDLRSPILATIVSVVAVLGLVGARVQGKLSIVSTGALVTVAFIALIVSVYRLGVALGPWKTDEAGQARPIYERQGFWVVLTGTLLYL